MFIKTVIINFANKIEVDKAVFFSILSKLWSLIAGPISALLITFFFSADIQGYYYTFGTILALQVFIELGLGIVTQQFTSHEWSNLSLNHKGEIVGDKDSLSRLISIARISLKWFGIGGIIASIGLVIGGYFFFNKSTGIMVDWMLPWTFLCIATGINILLTPVWSILEGCNQVKQLYRFRFFLGILGNIVAWVSIALGASLWTGFIVSLVSIISSLLFLKQKYFQFLKKLFFSPNTKGPKISWKQDMLPMQWKIAISWISGYLCFSLFIPVLFKYQGPVVAGQFGMTWSIIGVIGGIAGSWLSPKIPKFAILVAQKNYDVLDQLFWKLVRIIFFISFLISFFIWVFIFLINNINYVPVVHFSSRLLKPLPVAILLIAQILQVSSTPFSAYMRAHKQEPVMYISLAQGIITGFSILIIGKYYGVIGMSLGYLGAIIILLPFLIILWSRKRKTWVINTL